MPDILDPDPSGAGVVPIKTPYTFIRERIESAFMELAEAVDAGQVEIPGREISGIPMGIFLAQSYMLETWDEYAEPARESAP